MKQYWKYAVVALIAFLVGTMTVVSAQAVSKFTITDEEGRTARVGPDGRLLVNAKGTVSVDNLANVQSRTLVDPAIPDISTIVNLRAVGLNQDAPAACDVPQPQGFSYIVPEGSWLLITDLVAVKLTGGYIGLWTDTNGVIFDAFLNTADNSHTRLQTPLVVGPGQKLCPRSIGTNTLFVMGRLATP